MKIKASQIFADFRESGLLSGMTGPDRTVTGIASATGCQQGDLVFIEKQELLAGIGDRTPAAVVVPADLEEAVRALAEPAVLIATNVRLAHALLRQRYADRRFLASEWGEVHPTAVIHETAKIGPETVVGPYAVIGSGVRIGRRCAIMAGVVIEHDAIIGDDAIIHANAVIGYECELGNEVIVHAGSVIGSEGYGFAQDEHRRSHRIPQTGKVVIEDRVRLGANNCVDRATFDETRIGAGTKLDNLCHVAHNVTIGKDCLLTAGFLVAGSTKIGDRVIASGNSGIIDHLNVCDDVVLVHRAGVVTDIDEPGAYAGMPQLPLRTYMRNAVLMRDFEGLVRKIRELEERVAELSDVQE